MISGFARGYAGNAGHNERHHQFRAFAAHRLFQSWGSVFLGCGFCLLLISFILCIHAYFVMSSANATRNQNIDKNHKMTSTYYSAINFNKANNRPETEVSGVFNDRYSALLPVGYINSSLLWRMGIMRRILRQCRVFDSVAWLWWMACQQNKGRGSLQKKLCQKGGRSCWRMYIKKRVWERCSKILEKMEIIRQFSWFVLWWTIFEESTILYIWVTICHCYISIVRL